MWEAINWHRENNCSIFNLGRTDPGDEGLLNYKRLWGFKETQLKYHRFNFKKNAFVPINNKKQEIMAKLLKSLPTYSLRCIGNMTYKHFG